MELLSSYALWGYGLPLNPMSLRMSPLSVLLGGAKLNQKLTWAQEESCKKNRRDARLWLLDSGWYRIKGRLAHGEAERDCLETRCSEGRVTRVPDFFKRFRTIGTRVTRPSGILRQSRASGPTSERSVDQRSVPLVNISGPTQRVLYFCIQAA